MEELFSNKGNKNYKLWKDQYEIFEFTGYLKTMYFGYDCEIFKLHDQIKVVIPETNIEFILQGGFLTFVKLTEDSIQKLYILSKQMHDLIDKFDPDEITFKTDNDLEFMSTQIILSNGHKTKIFRLLPPLPKQKVVFKCNKTTISSTEDLLDCIEEMSH